MKRAAGPPDAAGGASRTAQTAFPGDPSSGGYQPDRLLVAWTSIRPRPFSSSFPASPARGTPGQKSRTRMASSPRSRVRTSRKEAAPARREASSAFVASSETISSPASDRPASCHSSRITRVHARAQPGAVGTAPRSRTARGGRAGGGCSGRGWCCTAGLLTVVMAGIGCLPGSVSGRTPGRVAGAGHQWQPGSCLPEWGLPVMR
jgi:hypothetical protein